MGRTNEVFDKKMLRRWSFPKCKWKETTLESRNTWYMVGCY